jgi:hypothetical protein
MITDAQWEETIQPKVMALPGMCTDYMSDFMCEPQEEGVSTYIKFMSDHGLADTQNGTVFGDYLKANGCTIVQDRPRSMVVLDADIARLFL